MVDQDSGAELPLDTFGHARRRFLQQTAFAATSAAATVLPQAGYAAPPSPAAKCSTTENPMKHVEGKVAFITGGSSGIGLGIAQACLDAGMAVAIGYRTKANMDRAMMRLASAGDRVVPIKIDVTDRRSMEIAAETTVKIFRKIHVIVNNAGVISGGPLTEATYDEWDRVLNVNLTGIFNGVRAFLPHIKVHGEGGQVVATSSMLGLISHGALGVYSTTKFAAVGMMESLRAELYATNIGVSVFCPGYVRESAGTSWMDPVQAGQLVVRGIRNNDLYILTHPEFGQGIIDRSEAIIASIPDDLHPPEARVVAEHAILRNEIYVAERNRKRCERAIIPKSTIR